MKTQRRFSFLPYLIEIAIYGVLVTGYFFLVLHLLDGWLAHMYARNRHLYAGVALLLIVAQGVVLEMVTTALLKLIRSKFRTG